MVATLTPPVKAAHGRRSWVVYASSFTVAGASTSILVGAGLGAAGALLGAGYGVAGVIAAALACLLAIARELCAPGLPLLQPPRQTPGVWARTMNGPIVPILWGLDLGLFFTTWFTFSGAWLLVVLAVLAGSPVFGAGLLAAYWIGRALGVWLGPLLLPSAASTPQLMVALSGAYRSFQLAHVFALALALVVLLQLLVESVAL